MATEQESLTGFAIWNLTNVESIPNLRVTKKKKWLGCIGVWDWSTPATKERS